MEEITVINNAEALEAITRSEVDLQIATAKKYPRSIGEFKEMALSMATHDQETAEGCFYSLSRGGKTIVGPSVRLAEIVVSAWGNIRAGARIVGNDGKTITAQAVCHDLQTNVAITIEVKKRITNSKGERYNDDMQVVAGNAASATALRNAIFKVVPKVFTNDIFEQCKKVAVGDALTLQTRRQNAIDYFKKLGVTEERILVAVGKKKIEDIDVEALTILLGIRTAIKDGDTTIEESFPKTNNEVKSDKVNDEVNKAAEKIKASAKTTIKVEEKKPSFASMSDAQIEKHINQPNGDDVAEASIAAILEGISEPGEGERPFAEVRMLFQRLEKAGFNGDKIMGVIASMGLPYMSKELVCKKASKQELEIILKSAK